MLNFSAANCQASSQPNVKGLVRVARSYTVRLLFLL